MAGVNLTGTDQEISKPTVTIVIPVYQGQISLPQLVEEIAELRPGQPEADHLPFVLDELILVHDVGPDGSAELLSELAKGHDWISVVWLTRNFGQHPATVAGIASSSADWIVTMDEDGLHDPATIVTLFERAMADGADLVYGQPAQRRPHPWYRNATSRLASVLFRMLVGKDGATTFASFRLLDGPMTRGLVAYCGHGVYLDVALLWVMSVVSQQPVPYREEIRGADQRSGYSFRTLLSHFRRLVLTSGTRPLRFVAFVGLLASMTGAVLGAVVIGLHLGGSDATQGWASTMITIVFFSGLIMMALGVVAEYLSVAVTMAAGRPMYMTTTRKPRLPQSPGE